MSDNIVRINNKKDSELSFEVTIQGITAETPDDLLKCRFVVEGSSFDIALPCHRVPETENRWAVVVPPLPFLKGDTHGFRLELVVDGYFFEPAAGNLIFVSEPEVNMAPSAKPKVTATFITADVEPEEKDDEKEETPEKKEEKPVEKEEKKEEKKPEKKEESTGPSADEIARQIVNETVGKPAEKPVKEGFLFSKDKRGKKRVQGLMDPETQREADAKAAKIKEILKT